MLSSTVIIFFYYLTIGIHIYRTLCISFRKLKVPKKSLQYMQYAHKVLISCVYCLKVHFRPFFFWLKPFYYVVALEIQSRSIFDREYTAAKLASFSLIFVQNIFFFCTFQHTMKRCNSMLHNIVSFPVSIHNWSLELNLTSIEKYFNPQQVFCNICKFTHYGIKFSNLLSNRSILIFSYQIAIFRKI